MDTENQHLFQKKGDKVELRLRLLDWTGEPRANQPYRLFINLVGMQGETDEMGELKETIPANAQKAELQLIDSGEQFELLLGHLDPIEEISGIQGRLENLGYHTHTIDNDFGPRTQKNLCRFQLAKDLPVSGEPDDPTRKKLAEEHGI